jgi:hypothetical protein
LDHTQRCLINSLLYLQQCRNQREITITNHLREGVRGWFSPDWGPCARIDAESSAGREFCNPSRVARISSRGAPGQGESTWMAMGGGAGWLNFFCGAGADFGTPNFFFLRVSTCRACQTIQGELVISLVHNVADFTGPRENVPTIQ